MRFAFRACAGMLLALAATARADVWDRDTGNLDDGNGTRNELVHGTTQVHDLAAAFASADQDWYAVRSRPYSSYEVVGEGITGDLAGTPGLTLDRVDSTGMVLTAGGALPGGGAGFTRSVRWRNDTASAVVDFIKASAPSSCNTSCDTNDQYRIRFFDTTMTVPRFNNSATQITNLYLQNPTNASITGTVNLFNSSTGAIAAQVPFTLPAHGSTAIDTSLSAPGVSGSVTITHNGRYGDLAGKAVSVEPATGFTFDTILIHGPR